MRTLVEAFEQSARAGGDRIALRGTRSLTWSDYAAESERLAGGLAALGVGKGDTVAMLMPNCVEQFLVDTAALRLGAIPWSIFVSTPESGVRELMERAGSSVLVTDVSELPPPAADFALPAEPAAPGDVATLVFTSGTTGVPKEVRLTHANILALLSAITEALPFDRFGRACSWLPFAHIADRMWSHYLQLWTASTVTVALDAGAVLDVLPDARPTYWPAVPRTLEKLVAGLRERGIDDPRALSGDERAEVRASLGLGDARWLSSGAAPVAPELLEYLGALGLPVCEAWGMSELVAVGAVNRLDAIRVGTVGQALPGVELTTADDGELLARGPTVAPGCIDADGWLHTGDLATIDADGYVRIVGRKKELIVTAYGKNIAPAAIEARLKTACPAIEHACVVGDGRPYLTALVVLNGTADVDTAFAGANAAVSSPERVRRWTVLNGDWSHDELTPLGKMRRPVIADKYRSEIEAMYT